METFSAVHGSCLITMYDGWVCEGMIEPVFIDPELIRCHLDCYPLGKSVLINSWRK